MLSINNISGSQASPYYANDNYKQNHGRANNLCFFAPKSVSIAALTDPALWDDIINVHDLAVLSMGKSHD